MFELEIKDQCIMNVTSSEIDAFSKGKVRNIFKLGDSELLLVTTDRLSAFDVVFPNGIPQKGVILNEISNLWMQAMDFIPNHLTHKSFETICPPDTEEFKHLAKRSVIVRKLQKINFECVVRGYLAGSGFKEYKDTGKVCGISLPPGLQMSEKLPEPIFTPSTKADVGHDENITFEKMSESTGKAIASELRDLSIKIFKFASGILEKNGIILADTKFEFGIDGNKIVLIDEVLTPDSSRFWDAEAYKPGTSPTSLDKQFVRDYLEKIKWNKQPPAPVLPPDVVSGTQAKYEKIRSILRNALEKK